ncbi:MAG TPA: FHA domain-containing protein [Anaerolineales bacterium]
MTGVVVLVLRLLAAAGLYAFLGYALWIMWRELRRNADAAVGNNAPPIRLEARSRNQTSVMRTFTQAEVVLGRDPLCDLVLADKAVSARHARLSFHDGQWWLDDMGSTNGTRLNRDPVDGSTVLTNGDEIKCGPFKVMVTLPLQDVDDEARMGGEDG